MLIKRGDGKILTVVEPTESLDEKTEEMLENEKKSSKDKEAGNKKS